MTVNTKPNFHIIFAGNPNRISLMNWTRTDAKWRLRRRKGDYFALMPKSKIYIQPSAFEPCLHIGINLGAVKTPLPGA